MRRLLLVTVIAFAVLGGGTASATIVPQRGMLGVRLGDTVREVRDRLGAPDGIRFVEHPILGRQRKYHYGRTVISFDGDARRARVIDMRTRSRRERLGNGIGVGSTKREVMRKVARVRCPMDEPFHCLIGRLEPGRVVTDFRLGRRNRVISIEIGRVID